MTDHTETDEMEPNVPLQEYVDSRINDLKELVAARFEALALALNVTKTELDRRLEGMNELREQISGERGRYATREMVDEKVSALEGRISRIQFSSERDAKPGG